MCVCVCIRTYNTPLSRDKAAGFSTLSRAACVMYVRAQPGARSAPLFTSDDGVVVYITCNTGRWVLIGEGWNSIPHGSGWKLYIPMVHTL